MTNDVKVQDKIFIEETDEYLEMIKKQKKIIGAAERQLRKVMIQRISGKTGDC